MNSFDQTKIDLIKRAIRFQYDKLAELERRISNLEYSQQIREFDEIFGGENDN